MQKLAAGLVLLTIGLPMAGQWLKYKTPGIPRTADGKPDLSAPVPKISDGKPDLSGLWQGQAGSYALDIASDLKPNEVQPWAQALFEQRSDNLSVDHPSIRCLPDIGPFSGFGMYKIVQTPGLILFLSEDGYFRQILTDGRPLPEDPNPTWQGYSVGHWDGDTLVIESAGFNDKTWLDFNGHPHSEQLRVIERYHRKDFGHMDVSLTFNDPKAYARPWTVSINVNYMPDTELLEYVCNENERDVRHFVVTDDDRKRARGVKIAPEQLAKYTGVYYFVDESGRAVDQEGKPLAAGAEPRLFTVSVANDQLTLQIPGANGKVPLAPQPDGKFMIAGQLIEFVTDGSGATTAFILHIVEGERKALRKGDAPH